MNVTHRSLAHLVQREQKILLFPAAAITTLVGLVVLFLDLSNQVEASQRVPLFVAGAGMAVYAWLLTLVLVPLSERSPSLRWAIAVLNGAGMMALSALLPRNLQPLLLILWILVVTQSSIFLGRWPAYLMIFIYSALAITLIQSLRFSWEDILAFSLAGILLNETLYRLGTAIAGKVQRLEAINRMSRTIATTIDVDKVISLVSASVQEALLADTYYVGLLNGSHLRLELFYDDGEFFPPIEIPVENTLAGWVIENRKPLLLRDMPKELPGLGVKAQVIGQPRPSLSWMGAPVAVGKRLIGIVAMAAYKRNAFDQADLDLLESMAQQTALVIDNAYRFAEVERQSRLDSLTQVFNHGQFLAFLDEYAQYASQSQAPLSLIMVDVDHFKQYNDSYGHLAGDQALTRLVSVLRQNIRSSDMLGRWGGEEFAVLLPETHGLQAMQVAERIRMNLLSLTITTQDGRSIPMPTVSQGIAIYSEAGGAEKLVDLADQRLYLAKERGRNQVEPDASHWTRLDPAVVVPRPAI